MDDKVNPTLVGAFVLLLSALLVAGVLWLAAGLGARRAMDGYQAFVKESVAGLNVDAPVKYLGVDIGKVSRIEIDPQNPLQVRLQFMIEHGTPIRQDSLAVLKSQGLTGIAYVELSGGSAGSPPLRAATEEGLPTIPFKLSLSARLENVLSGLMANVDRVSNNLDAMFDAGNRAALKSTLTDVAALAHALAAPQGALNTGIADAARAARGAALATPKLAPTLERVAAGAQAVERMADSAAVASTRAALAADVAASGVQQFSSETLPELARLMAELDRLSASLRRLSEQTAGQPNSLLIGRPSPAPGPGESATP